MTSGRRSDSDAARWRELVYRGVESDELDYKSAMNWSSLTRQGKAKLVRHCLAFANTRGGCIVIGVGEDRAGHPSLYQGLSPEEVHSFDPSAVSSFVHNLTDPPINFTIERPEVDGKRYAIFVVKPFSNLPHVCASGVEGELQQGVFYIRTPGASSRPAVSATELHGLIQRALRNQRAMLGQMLRGILLEARELGATGISAERRFTMEQEQFGRYLHNRWPRSSDKPGVRLEFYARPLVYEDTRCSLQRLRRGAKGAAGSFFPATEAAALYSVNTSLRIFDPQKPSAAQFFKSALLCCAVDLPLDQENAADCRRLRALLAEFVHFAGRFYAGMGMEETQLHLSCRIPHAEGIKLRWNEDVFAPYAGDAVFEAVEFPASELLYAQDQAAGKLFRGIGEQFLLPPRLLTDS